MNFLELCQYHRYFGTLMRHCLLHSKFGDIDYCRTLLERLYGAILFCFYDASWDEFKAAFDCYNRFFDAIWHLALVKRESRV